MINTKNTTWHNNCIKKQDRTNLKKQKPFIIWFTGLSGSGKSTLASALELKLFNLGYHTYILDGDNIRQGLNKDLSFDDNSRTENIRRVSEVCKLFIDSGTIILTAFISPFQKDRDYAKSLVHKDEFIEIFMDTPLEVCEKRDTKGLYKKARYGEINNFTGISSKYEKPINAQIVISTEYSTIENSVEKIIRYLEKDGYINVK